jgi:hypothetical protein
MVVAAAGVLAAFREEAVSHTLKGLFPKTRSQRRSHTLKGLRK